MCVLSICALRVEHTQCVSISPTALSLSSGGSEHGIQLVPMMAATGNTEGLGNGRGKGCKFRDKDSGAFQLFGYNFYNILFPMRISLQRLTVKVLKMGQFEYQSAGPGLCLQSQPVTSGLQLTKLFQTTLD